MNDAGLADSAVPLLAIVAIDGRRRVRMWSHGAELLFGWPRQEVLGRLLPTVPSPQEAELAVLLSVAGTSGDFATVLTRRQRRDGSMVDVSVSVTALPGSDTETPLYLALIFDLAERRSMPRALQLDLDRDELLNTLAADVATYRYRVKPAPGFDYVSPSIAVITGYEADQFYADPELPLKLIDPLGGALAAGPSRPGRSHSAATVRLRARDGREVHLIHDRITTRDAAGELLAVEGVLRDVTQRVRVRESLHEAQRREGLLLDSAPMVLFGVGFARGLPLAWLNGNASEVLGVSREQGLQHRALLRQRLHPSDQALLPGCLRALLREGACRVGVHWLCGDDRYHDFVAQARLERSADGAPRQIVAAALDGGVSAKPAGPEAPPPGEGQERPPTARRRLAVELTLPTPPIAPSERPGQCPRCGSPLLQRYQSRTRRLADGREVQVVRYRCGSCRRTFSHYPPGVDRGSQGQSGRLLTAILYGLGLSAARVSAMLDGAGIKVSPRSVWRSRGELGERLRQMRPPTVSCVPAGERSPLHGDVVTVVQVNVPQGGEWPVTVTLDVWQPQLLALPWLKQSLEAEGVRLTPQAPASPPH